MVVFYNVFQSIKIISYVNSLPPIHCLSLWIHTIQSHIFFFFTDILHIFFHLLIFVFLFQNRNKFFMTYFHVNQCLRYYSFNSIEILASMRILSCFFFLFLAILGNLFIVPIVREKIKVKRAPAIPTYRRNDTNPTTCCA